MRLGVAGWSGGDSNSWRNLPKGARITRTAVEMCQFCVPSCPGMKCPIRGDPLLRCRVAEPPVDILTRNF